jgi:hypothetical protein
MLIKELRGDFLTDTIKICDLFSIKILIERRIEERSVHGLGGVVMNGVVCSVRCANNAP